MKLFLLAVLGVYLLSGCAKNERPWQITPQSARFGWQQLTLRVPANQPYAAFLLRNPQGELLQRVHWVVNLAGWVTFDYPWQPNQGLQVWAIQGDKAGEGTTASNATVSNVPVFLGNLATPNRPLQALKTSLHLTAGAPVLRTKQALWLPAGKPLNLALAVTLQRPQPQTVQVEIRTTPLNFLHWRGDDAGLREKTGPTQADDRPTGESAHRSANQAGVGAEAGAGTPASQPASQLALPSTQGAVLRSDWYKLKVRGQRVYLALPFWLNPPIKVAPGASANPSITSQALGKGVLHWQVKNPQGVVLARGQQAIRAVAWQHLQGALVIEQHRFPAAPGFGQGGQSGLASTIATQQAGQITLHPSWLAPLKPWLPSPQQRAWVGLRVLNQSTSVLPLAFRLRVQKQPPSLVSSGAAPTDPVTGFAKPNAAFKPVLQVLGPNQTGEITLPLHWQAEQLQPGRYWRCVQLFFWGVETPLHTDCRPLKVAKASAGSGLLGLLALGCLGISLVFCLRLGRWLQRLALWEVALLALTFAITLLTVSLPGVLLSAGTTLLLGPFGFLLDGLVYKLGVFGWAAALMGCLRRRGVFFVFFLLWQCAQAALHGLFSPLLVLSAAVAACLGEAAFWLGGVSRTGSLKSWWIGLGIGRVISPASAVAPPSSSPLASPGGVAAPAVAVLSANRSAISIPPAFLPALWIALGEGLAIGFYLLLAQTWQRLHLANWFVLLQALSGGTWAGLGAWLGLRAAQAQGALIPSALGFASPKLQPPPPPTISAATRAAPRIESVSLQLPALDMVLQTGMLLPAKRTATSSVTPARLRPSSAALPRHPAIAPSEQTVLSEQTAPSRPFWPHSHHLCFEAGKLNVILGPSGCGKSTLLRLLKGLLPLPQGASITLDGQPSNPLPTDALIANPLPLHALPLPPFLYLSQQLEWQAVLDGVADDVRLAAWIGAQQRATLHCTQPSKSVSHTHPAQYQTTAQHALQQLGLAHLAGRTLQYLSGGELQRALLAALYAQAIERSPASTVTLSSADSRSPVPAMLKGQSMWLLDEPFAHQDSQGKGYINAMLANIVTQQGLVVLVEHRLEVLAKQPIKAWRFDDAGALHAVNNPTALFAVPAKGKSPSTPAETTPFQSSSAKSGHHWPSMLPALSKAEAMLPANGQKGVLCLQGVGIRPPRAGFAVHQRAPHTADHPANPTTSHFTLQNVTFSLAAGKIYWLQGPNGSGKTLLISAMAGFVVPSKGRIVWKISSRQPNQKPTQHAMHRFRLAEQRALVGLAPQRPAASIFAPTTLQAMQAPLMAGGHGKRESQQIAQHWLGTLGLGAKATTHPQQLSAGELRRLAIGRVLAQGPLVLLLDEPFAGLDAQHAQGLMALIQHYLDQHPQRRLLLSTHDDPDGMLASHPEYIQIHTESFLPAPYASHSRAVPSLTNRP